MKFYLFSKEVETSFCKKFAAQFITWHPTRLYPCLLYAFTSTCLRKTENIKKFNENKSEKASEKNEAFKK